MFCSNCGEKNAKENLYCFNCGSKLSNMTEKNGSGNKETSLVLGIICLVSSFIINIFCFIPGIISIIYARRYKKESGKLGVGFGLSLGGMIYSIIVLFLIILFVIFIGLMVNETNNEGSYKYNYDTEFTYNIPYI